MSKGEVAVQKFTLGMMAEHQVYADLLGKGYIVGQMMPYAPYDLVAEEPTTHRVYRVQVKLAHFPKLSGNPEFYVKRGRGGGRITYYEPEDFDMLAIVIPDEGILYTPWHGQWKGRVIITDDLRAESLP